MTGKSLVYTKPGHMVVVEREVPPPREGEVIIRVAYCGICGTDRHIFHGLMDERVKPPKVVGHEMSGTIYATHPLEGDWTVGDKVTVRPLDADNKCPACLAGLNHICQNLKFIGIERDGAFQQYWRVPTALLHRLPPQMDLALAALTEPLAVACHDIERATINPDEKAVVIGGGPIGILIALVAQLDGAKATLFELNEDRRNFARSLGINAIDPTSVDPESYILDWTDGAMADVVFEVSGSKPGAALMTALCKPRGRVVLVGIFGSPAAVNLKEVFLKEIEIRGARVYEVQNFERSIKLLSEGQVDWRKLISQVAPLEKAEDCLKSLDENPALIKILIDMGDR